jgi:hypothetical protein
MIGSVGPSLEYGVADGAMALESFSVDEANILLIRFAFAILYTFAEA